MTVDDARFATTPYPGMTVLLTDLFSIQDARMRPMADGLVNRMPVLVIERLKDAPLPAAAAAALGKVSLNPDPTFPESRWFRADSTADSSTPSIFTSLAALRDALRAATTDRSPDSAAEPSPAVLANLIEEEAFLAVVTRTQASRFGNGQTYQVDQTVKAARPILRHHPWGPYVDALAVGYDPAEQGAVKADLAKVDPRDAGRWVQGAISATYLANDPREFAVLADRWSTPSELAADAIPADVGSDPGTTLAQADRATGGDLLRYDELLRRQSPRSAAVLCEWMRAVPPDRVLHGPGVYESTLAEVRAKFADRVTVVNQMADWCDARGAYPDALALLLAIDPSDPSPARCRQLGRLCWKLGRPDEAIAQLTRGADLATSGIGNGIADRAALCDEVAADDVDLGRPDAGLDAVERSADQATTESWDLMARCHEAAGRLDDAETCLRMAAAADAAAAVDYSLWAKRHARTNAPALGRQAAALKFDTPVPNALLLLADGDARRAYKYLLANADQVDVSRTRGEWGRPWLTYAQFVVAAAGADALDATAKRFAARGFADDGFSAAFAGLVHPADPAAATAAYDDWIAHQLDRHDRVDWLSLAGRLLVATGHKDQGRRYLAAAVQTTQYERPNYALAWLALADLGDDPATLAHRPATPRPTTAP